MLPPTAPKLITAGCISVGLAFAFAVTGATAGGLKVIDINDQCDPTTFNNVFGDGTCVAPHAGVKFDNFIRELGQTQKVGAWNFAPRQVRLRDGEAFQAENRGGEEHTFTEVDEFGGGFIQLLNDLSGNPVPAPECLSPDLELIPAGGVSDSETEEPGIHHYQCCIHPWMRVDVVVR